MNVLIGKPRPMYRALRSPAANEGQRLLRKAVRRSSLASIARAVGCKSRENCRSWLLGAKTPNSASRTKLERAFGIPPAAWAQLPIGHPARRHQHIGGSDTAVEAHSTSNGSTLDDCLALLADMRSYRQRAGLLPADQVRYMDCETRILALRARLERDVELSEDRYVREHPAWRRLRDAILVIVRPHPEIMKQLVDAMSAVTSD